MTLHAIVHALGGDLYSGGSRASIPAPGHSDRDRSVSLWLTGGRVVIHGFGGADWRAVRDDLRDRGFIDDGGRLTGGGFGQPSTPRPDRRIRRETASRLWAGIVGLTAADPAYLYLRRRAVRCGRRALNLGYHPRAPLSVYREGHRRRPAMVARISDPDERLTGVELTYLEPGGRLAAGLRLVRKTVGLVPPGSAVRLFPVAEEMLVGEGVITTLSAVERFSLPGWALMAAHNLAAWTPPREVRRVLIAADRGRVGEGATVRLRQRLITQGLCAEVSWPGPPFGDWNEAAIVAASRRKEGGR
jgi:putative DNA primase/helicase